MTLKFMDIDNIKEQQNEKNSNAPDCKSAMAMSIP